MTPPTYRTLHRPYGFRSAIGSGIAGQSLTSSVEVIPILKVVDVGLAPLVGFRVVLAPS